MTDPTAVCVGVAAQLTAVNGTTAFGTAPGQINPPCAVVIPGVPAVTYGVTMDGEVNLTLRIVMLASAAADDWGQATLSSYIASSGPLSVPAAIQHDPSIGGLVEFALVVRVNQYGLIDYAGQQYFGCTFEVQAGAHLLWLGNTGTWAT